LLDLVRTLIWSALCGLGSIPGEGPTWGRRLEVTRCPGATGASPDRVFPRSYLIDRPFRFWIRPPDRAKGACPSG
jgi:hypothetical protein